MSERLELELVLDRLSEARADYREQADRLKDLTFTRRSLLDYLRRCHAAFGAAEALLDGTAPGLWWGVQPLHQEAVIGALTSIQVDLEMQSQDQICPLTAALHRRCAQLAVRMIGMLGGRTLDSFNAEGQYESEVS